MSLSGRGFCSAIYFLNLRGEVLVYRAYRDDIGRHMADAFRTQVLQNKDASATPVVTLGSCSFLYTRENNVYVLVLTQGNTNAAAAFRFMQQVITLFKSYFNTFDEDSLRNNFVLIYELLDEVMDNGYPQILTPEALKLYITQQGVRSELAPFEIRRRAQESRNATMQVTGAVSWRREGLKYKKNEVYLDIVESINLLMTSKGVVLRSDVSGKIQMNCLLSGMPELKLGLNDMLSGAGGGDGPDSMGPSSMGRESPGGYSSGGGGGGSREAGKSIELDDVTFHQCVNLSRFASDKTVSFVPPDGAFELMKYRVTDDVILPFKVMPLIREVGRSRIEAAVKVRAAGFSSALAATNVVVRLPVPSHTARATITVTGGKAKYKVEGSCLVWKIKRFPGQAEMQMTADIELSSTLADKKVWARPPISMEFQVPMFTSSGLKVRFLKVWEKSGYPTVKWVRYLSRSGEQGVPGSYEIRITDAAS